MGQWNIRNVDEELDRRAHVEALDRKLRFGAFVKAAVEEAIQRSRASSGASPFARDAKAGAWGEKLEKSGLGKTAREAKAPKGETVYEPMED